MIKDFDLGRELESILLEQNIMPGNDSLRFFKILTAKSFEDANLSIERHALAIEYTFRLLNSYIRPSNRFSLNYIIDLLTNKLISNLSRKKFADDVYIIVGIFPKYLEKRITDKKIYVDSSKKIYRSFSNREGDVFYQLSKNLSSYIHSLNIMKDRYFDGNYAKNMMKSDRILH